jgi:hypothetical protein
MKKLFLSIKSPKDYRKKTKNGRRAVVVIAEC